MTKHPNQLGHGCRLQINIFLDRWDNVALEDIERHNTMVNKRRTFEGLKRFLGALSICDLNRMIKSIPCVVGDLYFDQEQYLNATAAFQSGGDFNKAEDSSEAFLNFWLPDSHHLDKQGASRSILLLQNLQNDPERTARTKATQCVKILGHRVIKIVCEHKSVDPTLLHLFCKTSFHNEVLAQLEIENKENLIDVVHWFISHDDKEHAAAFISDRISQWKNSDLVDFVFKGLLRTGVAEEYCRRGMHFDAATIFLDCKEYDRAFVAANLATLSRKGAETCAFKLVKKIKYVRLPSKVPQRITLLWRLFYEPEKLDKKCCNECVNDFGVSVIQEFVLRSAPHCTKVKNEDGTTVEIYLDVIDLLSRFGRSANMPLHAVLKRLHQYKISADTFIDFHMKSWSVKELFDIDKMRHQAKYVKVLVNIRDNVTSRHTIQQLRAKSRLFDQMQSGRFDAIPSVYQLRLISMRCPLFHQRLGVEV